jgi:hypothetical protein
MFGAIEFAGLHQVFGQIVLAAANEVLGRVVVMQPLSPAFFLELKAVLGKDVILLVGDRQVGSTFVEAPGPFQPTTVAPGLFTAFNGRFIGMERGLGDVRLSGQHETMLVVRGDVTVEIVNTIELGFPVALTDEIADFIQHTTVGNSVCMTI